MTEEVLPQQKSIADTTP